MKPCGHTKNHTGSLCRLSKNTEDIIALLLLQTEGDAAGSPADAAGDIHKQRMILINLNFVVLQLSSQTSCRYSILLSADLPSLPTTVLRRFSFPDKITCFLLSVASGDVFYCLHFSSEVSCSRCIKNEKGRPRPKFRPFSSHQQLMGCHARKLLMHLP